MSRARLRSVLAAAVLGAILFEGCGGDDNGGTTTLTPAISITLSASSLSVVQGTTGTVTVTLARTGGFSGDVAIGVTGLPTGVTVSSATIASGATSATLTFTVAANAAPGNSSVTINASGTGVTAASATVALTVTAATVSGNYTLTASPAAPSIAQGGSATVVITVNRTGGFAGPVALAVTGAANGLGATLATASTTGTTDTLTLTASATATVGAQTLTIKGTSTGLTDQTVTVQVTITAQTSSGNVTWQFCGSLGIPIWVAFQDGTSGAWTHVVGTNDSYTFNVTQSVGGVAYVLPYATGGFDLEVFYGSKADLQGRANEVCNGAVGAGKTVTAAVAGTATGDVVLGSLGPSAGVVAGSTMTFSNVPNGNLDLVTGRSTLTINGTSVSFNLAKMIIRRNLNPAAGSALATIDFGAAEAFAPVTKNLTITNLGTDISTLVGLYFTTNNTFATYFLDPTSGGASRTYAGVPAANQVTGDLHVLAILALPSLTGTTPQREALFAFHTAVDETFALGPALTAPTVSTLSATGYARLRAAISVQSQYNKLFMFTATQAGAAPRKATIQQTAGYSSASTLNLDVPDLSGVQGFDVNWGLKAGTLVNWTVSATGWAGAAGIGQPPFTDGGSFMFASFPGTITP
ncbi:MAG TPA: hypothetical protein VGQ44_02880 [Gemmatimonadaceae bacterium]|nr:hypothetical protein [Gemmatimonadaceae bacterium]